MTLTGGCLCGDVRYEVDADPKWVTHCHCSRCRKQTGALIGTYAGFAAGTVRWTGREPTRYRSTDDVERSFCSKCGGTLGFHRVHETSLTVGSLDNPDALQVDRYSHAHVFCRERVVWFDTKDDWPRRDRFGPGREHELKELAGQTIRG